MENEKQLDVIDRNELKEKLQEHHDFFVDGVGGFSYLTPKDKARVDEITHCIAETVNAPTVDAVVLPCKIGDDVYIIPSKTNFKLNVLAGLEKNNRVYRQKVEEIVFKQDCWYVTGNADKEYGTGRTLLDRFYKETWFLTEEEAKTALAKIDGGNENGVDD